MGYVRLQDVTAARPFDGVTHRVAVNREIEATGIQMGEAILEPGASIPPHYHDVDDAVIVISGRGTFVLDQDEVRVETGMAVVAPAGMRHGLRNDGEEPLRIIFAWPTTADVKRYWSP